MISALTSLIWGSELEEDVIEKEEVANEEAGPEPTEISAQIDNSPPEVDDTLEDLESESSDWIFVQPKNEKETQKRRRHARFDGSSDDASTASESAESVNSQESFCVEPPSCFRNKKAHLQQLQDIGSLENLLIEHPSMSIYQSHACESSDGEKENYSTETRCDGAVVASGPSTTNRRSGTGRHADRKVRTPLRDILTKANVEQHRNTHAQKKSLERGNKAQARGKMVLRNLGKHPRAAASPLQRQ